jgi:hypothetical protein
MTAPLLAWPSVQPELNLPVLLETRLLVQANSGGGKSYAVRRLLEQTAPHVQQLVIDPEGEFASLREKFDYVIAAPHDGDALASPKTAALLAKRLLETGVSAVLDIYDLKAHDRHLFVKRFLEALINAPRALWHPLMVVLDEAHTFCPQSGSSEAAGAVIDLATRGRKRGQCLVLATQRLSKLHKDAAAEMLNKLVGRTGLDVDVKRAADELGLTAKDAVEQLRNLPPGHFYAYGPALSPAPRRIITGPVLTTHPKAGDRLMQKPPAPSRKILESLGKLADLQQEAEQEAADLESLRNTVADLRRQLASAARAPAPAAAALTVVTDHHREHLEAAIKDIQRRAAAALSRIVVSALPDAVPARPKASTAPTAPAVPSEGVSGPQQRLLDVLAALEAFGLAQADKAMVAAHAKVSPTSGSYANNLGRLRTQGLIDYPAPGTACLTDAGRAKANPPARTPTLADLHASWYGILAAPAAKILRVLVEAYPGALSKEDVAERIGVSPTSGSYANNLGHLRTLGAITYPTRGAARAADLLFPKGGSRG